MIIALGHKGNCISLIKDISAFHDKQKKKVNTMKYINDRTFSNNQSYNWIVKLRNNTYHLSCYFFCRLCSKLKIALWYAISINNFILRYHFSIIHLLIFLNILPIFQARQLMVDGNSKMLLFLSIKVRIFSFSLLITTVYLLNCILWHLCHGKNVNNEVGDSTISHTKK